MEDDRYQNRELDRMFKEQQDAADSFHELLMQRMDTFENKVLPTLTSIEIQTKKTNGRVTALETNIKLVAVAISVILLLKFPEVLSILKAVL